MKLKFSLAILALSLFVISGTTSALTSSNSVQVEFGFAPVLSLDLSSNELLISELVPGGMRNSNNIDITVKTNNVTGYELTANVGDNNNASRDLTHTTADASFSSIDIDSNLTSLTEPSTWGFSKDNGSHYSGLPLYTDLQNVALLNDSTGAANEATSFVIGAKAAAGQIAGTYTNTINFLAIAKPEPFLAMQDVTWDDIDELAIGDVITLSDSRTGNNYEVTTFELSGVKTLWMNSNLKLPAGKRLTPDDSNVSSDFTLSTEAWTSSEQGYWCRQIMAEVDGEYFYNWFAATANDASVNDPTDYSCTNVIYDSFSVGDICPKGWRLPRGEELDDLLGDENIRSGFGDNGLFSHGSFYAQVNGGFAGGWWSTEHYNSNGIRIVQKYIGYSASKGFSTQTMGHSVRCLYGVE